MELNVVNKYGQCRCCSEMGRHRDLEKVYCWNGIREVYSDILLECFNLSLSPNTGLSKLICSECITKLREASSFKMLVVNTEVQLLEALDAGQNNLKSGIADIKIELPCSTSVKEEQTVDSDQEWPSEQPDEAITYQDETPKNNQVEGEAELIARFASLKSLPRKPAFKIICQNYVKHLETLKGKVITGKSLERLLRRGSIVRKASQRIETVSGAQDMSNQITQFRQSEAMDISDIDKVKNPNTVERLTHATNISTILEFSNVTAFKSKFQRAYPCFYCEKLFEDFEELKKHQKLDHVKNNLSKCVLQKYKVGRPDGVVVYVDVSDLKCTVCDKDILTLNDLKKHLTDIHQKKMYLDVTDRVIPFKVKENNFECQICGNHYETFGSIERHMNTHYSNYVCEECGSGFVTKQRLKIHGYVMHSGKSKQHPCEVCQKQFTSQQKMKYHVSTVHENVKKYKCNRCPERFNEYFRRHKHMVLVHGVAPLEYKCNVCDKSFDRRYGLSIHMRTHIQQKDIYCEICPYRCFTKGELRYHMVKHNGQRIHECSVCKKSYAREKTLKEHMRIHTNDRRYVCPVPGCGQAFIQNCSLKSHIRSHHQDYR